MGEWRRSARVAGADISHTSVRERVDRAITITVQREMDRLERWMVFLASVGATAPFVGLLGTVWGIYHALTAIGIAVCFAAMPVLIMQSVPITETAAATRDRMWNFVDLFYRNQGAENSGYVTDAYLRRIAGASGVDVARAFEASTGGAVSRQLDAAAREAQRFHVDSTPSFVLSRAGEQPRRLSPSSLTVDQFAGPIERLIGPSPRAHTFGS